VTPSFGSRITNKYRNQGSTNSVNIYVPLHNSRHQKRNMQKSSILKTDTHFSQQQKYYSPWATWCTRFVHPCNKSLPSTESNRFQLHFNIYVSSLRHPWGPATCLISVPDSG
jgi:hypothetical protein